MAPGGRLHALAALALVLLASLGSAQASVPGGPAVTGPGLSRVLAPGLVQGLPAGPEPSASASSAPASGPTWTIRELDSDPYSGYEVAAFQLDASTAFVAYKRYHDVSQDTQYAPGEVVVLRTTDGGATWGETVVDDSSPDDYQLIDNAIAIDGAGDDVYLLYYERSSGYFADMKLRSAHSADRGASWSLGTVVDGYGGDFVGLDVLDGSTALASWHGESYDEGAWTGLTTDGGATWTLSHVAFGLGNGWYTSAAAAGLAHLHTAYYNALSPNYTDLRLSTSHDAGASWSEQVVADPADHYTGLGADLAAPNNQTLFLAYEDDSSSEGSVLVSASKDGGATWTRTLLQADPMVGWNQDVEAIDGSEALVSYWWGEAIAGPETGRARLAHTVNAGATWSLETVPESMYVTPFLDLAAVNGNEPFVAYQVWDPATGAKTLHVAHKSASPPPPPPTGNGTVLVHVDVDLGTLGDHRQVDVPVVLDAAYGHLQVTTSCPSSVGEAALLSGGHPLQSAAIACTLGRQTASLPPTLPEGNYLLQVAAAGSGHFVVEVTGTRVP